MIIFLLTRGATIEKESVDVLSISCTFKYKLPIPDATQWQLKSLILDSEPIRSDLNRREGKHVQSRKTSLFQHS
ncbi:SWI5-dependent HO expression protein [Dirofilaria immitis]